MLNLEFFRGSTGENLNPIDFKVLKSLLFGYPEKLVRKCQEKSHKQAVEGKNAMKNF